MGHQSELRGCVSGFAYSLLLFFCFNPVALDLQGASQSLTFIIFSYLSVCTISRESTWVSSDSQSTDPLAGNKGI